MTLTDRIAGVTADGNDLRYSGKHKKFGGNVQFLAAPVGNPLGIFEAEPGTAPDIVTRRHALPAL